MTGQACSVPYPLFTMPKEYAAKLEHERNREEAKAYFKWFVANVPRRVGVLLGYFNESLTGAARADLERLGQKVAHCARADWCSHIPEEPTMVDYKGDRFALPLRRVLTPAGRSLALDMGLLLGHYLIELRHPFIKWKLKTTGPTTGEYHTIYVSFKEMTPSGLNYFRIWDGSISLMSMVLDGSQDGTLWRQKYDLYIKTIESRETLA